MILDNKARLWFNRSVTKYRRSRTSDDLANALARDGFVYHEVTGGRPDMAMAAAARRLNRSVAIWQQTGDDHRWFWMAILVGVDAEPLTDFDNYRVRRYRVVQPA